MPVPNYPLFPCAIPAARAAYWSASADHAIVIVGNNGHHVTATVTAMAATAAMVATTRNLTTSRPTSTVTSTADPTSSFSATRSQPTPTILQLWTRLRLRWLRPRIRWIRWLWWLRWLRWLRSRLRPRLRILVAYDHDFFSLKKQLLAQ